MMKDDEESVDPLDELLDAYKTSVYMGLGELADSIMKIVHELQKAIMQDNPMKGYRKGYSMEYKNPVACLSKAYLALLEKPQYRVMASKVLQLLDIAASQVYSQDAPDMGEMMQSPRESEGEVNGGYMERMPVMLGGGGRFYSVRREIRQEGGQFCVFSQTGRAFGCYESRDKALKRLAQLEQFSAERLSKAEKSVLIEMHNTAHKVPTVTEAIKTIHDLVSDELQIVHGMSEPFIFEPTEMLEVIEGKDAALISKAAEYRYTLGPAYVPNMEDAHGEFTDEVTLQKAMWDWVRKGDRTIYLQHSDKPAGEMVEMLTWPFPIEADLQVPNQGVTKFMFPADTPFLGVIWEPWAWDMVKAGELRGYSIGGGANRVEADIPAAATMFNKGEAAGHPFRGNQYTSPSSGGGGGSGGGPGSGGDSSAPRPKKGESLLGNKNAVGTKVTIQSNDKYNGKTGVVTRQSSKNFMVKVDGNAGNSLSFKGQELIAS